MPVNDTSHYKDPAVDTLMQQAAKEVDHAKRIQMYAQIQKMILDGAPWVFVNSTLQVRATRKNVKGFELNPTQMFFDMDQVSLQP
jgi:peptide/nickel transport system substrate-binding protein